MIVTKVILQDYGVYRGRNEFDFTCTEKKPIVLIGGTNGAGKTTLFESIMLCLYGISTMGKRSTKKAYNKFLTQKIHRYLKSATPADHASITVQFKFFHNGRETEYKVERSWRKEDGVVDEQLIVKKRGQDQNDFGTLDAIEKSYWQSFIEDLIERSESLSEARSGSERLWHLGRDREIILAVIHRRSHPEGNSKVVLL